MKSRFTSVQYLCPPCTIVLTSCFCGCFSVSSSNHVKCEHSSSCTETFLTSWPNSSMLVWWRYSKELKNVPCKGNKYYWVSGGWIRGTRAALSGFLETQIYSLKHCRFQFSWMLQYNQFLWFKDISAVDLPSIRCDFCYITVSPRSSCWWNVYHLFCNVDWPVSRHWSHSSIC